MKYVVGLALVTCLACADQSGDHVVAHAGTLQLTLATSGGNIGALVVVVSGGPVTSVAAASTYDIASNADSAGTHIMIIGTIGGGALATLQVPDVNQAGAYVATVEQVADRTTLGLLDAAPYQVTVTRP
jgi:hypothetical protein